MKRYRLLAGASSLLAAGALTLAGGFTPAAAAPAYANACAGDNLSPTSRTVTPTGVYATTGSVGNASAVLTGGSTRLSGNGSSVTLDFHKEVGGIITLRFAGASD